MDGLQAVDRFHALHPLKPGPLPAGLSVAGYSLGFAGAQYLGEGRCHGPGPGPGPGTHEDSQDRVTCGDAGPE